MAQRGRKLTWRMAGIREQDPLPVLPVSHGQSLSAETGRWQCAPCQQQRLRASSGSSSPSVAPQSLLQSHSFTSPAAETSVWGLVTPKGLSGCLRVSESASAGRAAGGCGSEGWL